MPYDDLPDPHDTEWHVGLLSFLAELDVRAPQGNPVQWVNSVSEADALPAGTLAIVLVPLDATPDLEAPTTPTGLSSGAKTSTTVDLSWNASSDNVGVTAYDILIAGSVVTSALAGTSATVTGLSPNTAYSFTVRARDAAGNVSAQSTALVVTTSASSDTTPPSAPGSFTSTGHTGSSVSLSWAASTDNVAVTGYEVFVDGSPTPSLTTAALAGTVTGLTPGTSYSFTVKARDAAGNRSAASSAVVVVTDAASYTLTDDFNRANAGTLGAAWVEVGANVHKVISNMAAPASTVTPTTIYDTACATDNNGCKIAIVTAAGSSMSILCRNDRSVNNYYRFFYNGTQLQLGKNVAGTFTSLGSPYVVTLASGDEIEIQATGTTIKGYLNGVEVCSVTDSSITSGKYVGIRSSGSTGVRYDDFAGGDV